MRARWLPLLIAVALAVPTSAGLAGRRANQRFLARILAVDGPGSGVDADTLRGLSPDQVKADVAGDVLRRLEALEARFVVSPDALYAHSARATLTPGQEQHLYADCDDSRDVAISCSGGAFQGATESPITWMGVIRDGSLNLDRCLVVVHAGSSAPQTQIEATVRCLAVRG